MDDCRHSTDLINNIKSPIGFLENRVNTFLDSKGSADGERARVLLLEASAHKDGTSLVQCLLDYKVDPNKIPENFVRAPLYMACQYNNISTVKILLDKKADVNVKTKGSERDRTPLHAAALKGLPDIADILLEKQPDLDVQDHPLNETPLHDVVLTCRLENDALKRIEFIKRLIRAGASPYIKDMIYNATARTYVLDKNVYEFIEEKRGPQVCAEIKKYRSELRFNIYFSLRKQQVIEQEFYPDIAKFIANLVYPNNPEKS